MSEQPAVATPGVGRIIQFSVNGHEFCVRRPSRADVAEITRRYTAKLLRACPGVDFALNEVAKATLDRLDGDNLYDEARLEVLLVPRAATSALGERAPSHWLRQITGPDEKTIIANLITFDNVDPDEFAEVARFVADALQPKKKPETATSTDSAPAAINA